MRFAPDQHVGFILLGEALNQVSLVLPHAGGWRSRQHTRACPGPDPGTLAPDTVGSEARKPTSLRGIADKANADKQHRFRDLYRCLNVELLLDCWGDLNKDAAGGVDGVTWQAYAENLQANVEALVERLKQKRYRAKLIRRRDIPKGNGQERP